VLASLLLIESWPQPVGVHVPPEERPGRARAVARLEVPITHMSDLITLYRAIGHRKPVVNGYSGYFAQHYAAMQALLERHEPMVLSYLTSLGALEVVVNEDENQAARWRAYFAAYPGAEVAYSNDSYTTFRLPPNPERYSLPTLQGQPLQISAITASLYQDLVGRMIDGDRISRWHTGGPQDPTNEVLVDLGASRKVTGVEMQIGGYVADFPRELTIDLSEDGATWRTGWSGSPGFVALLATLEQPLVGPLRFPLDGTTARFIRMRQTGETRIYYWSIAELRVLGS
jgi:F5/8 type C domain